MPENLRDKVRNKVLQNQNFTEQSEGGLLGKVWDSAYNALAEPWQLASEAGRELGTRGERNEGAIDALTATLHAVMSPINAVVTSIDTALKESGALGKETAEGVNRVLNLPFEAIGVGSELTKQGLGAVGVDTDKISRDIGISQETDEKANRLLTEVGGLLAMGKIAKSAESYVTKTAGAKLNIPKRPEPVKEPLQLPKDAVTGEKFTASETGNAAKRGITEAEKIELSKLKLNRDTIQNESISLKNEIKELQGKKGKEITARRKEIMKKLSELNSERESIDIKLNEYGLDQELKGIKGLLPERGTSTPAKDLSGTNKPSNINYTIPKEKIVDIKKPDADLKGLPLTKGNVKDLSGEIQKPAIENKSNITEKPKVDAEKIAKEQNERSSVFKTAQENIKQNKITKEQVIENSKNNLLTLRDKYNSAYGSGKTKIKKQIDQEIQSLRGNGVSAEFEKGSVSVDGEILKYKAEMPDRVDFNKIEVGENAGKKYNELTQDIKDRQEIIAETFVQPKDLPNWMGEKALEKGIKDIKEGNELSNEARMIREVAEDIYENGTEIQPLKGERSSIKQVTKDDVQRFVESKIEERSKQNPVESADDFDLTEPVEKLSLNEKDLPKVKENKVPLTKPEFKSNFFVNEETYNNSLKESNDLFNSQVNFAADPASLGKLTKNLVIQATYHIERGIKKFADFSKVMIEKFGEQVKRYLPKAWVEANKQAKPRAFNDVYKKLPDDVYIKNRETFKKQQSVFYKASKVFGEYKDVKKIKSLYMPVQTAIKRISPEISRKLTKMDFNIKLKMRDRLSVAKEFVDKQFKMSLEDKADLDLALKNKDWEYAESILRKNGAWNEFLKLQDMLKEIAKENGMDNNRNKYYFPRKVKDYEGFVKLFEDSEHWNIFKKLIDDKEAKLGRPLDVEERANLINNALRGYNPGITLSRIGNLKDRIINKLDNELNEFYYDSPTALRKYLEEVTEYSEARKFFGKGDFDINDSVGKMVDDLIQSKQINVNQARELVALLKSRFNTRNTPRWISNIKNLGYATTLTNVVAATTNVKDIAISVYKAPLETIPAIKDVITRKGKLTAKDLGIDNIAQEMADKGVRDKWVDRLFTASGFKALDFFGKEVFVNAALNKYQRLAKAGKLESIMPKIKEIFGEDTQGIINELKSGKVGYDTSLLMFHELTGFQPLTLSQMPKSYLDHPGARLAYTMKSYSLKQLDFFANETWRKIGDKNLPKAERLKAVRNMAVLSSLLVGMGASVDAVKDLMLGRKVEFSDKIVDNILNLFLMSKYEVTKGGRQGLPAMVGNKITPPLNIIEDPITDAVNIASGKDKVLKTTRDIPVIGRFWHEKIKENSKGKSFKPYYNTKSSYKFNYKN